jgi:rubrerythrin
MNEDSSMNKKNVLSLILSLVALALAVSPAAAVAHTSRIPNGQERQRAETRAPRRPAKRSKSAQAQVLTYTCPMHHDVHLKSPGDCPVCGMELEAEKPGKAKSE